MIKTQDQDIARLKYVILEAEAEKQKQRKDYEMVINERDILGTQLIKRSEELALLYEKIKIQRCIKVNATDISKEPSLELSFLHNVLVQPSIYL